MMSEKKMDRFDFEQQIQKCWMITDDISDVSEGILDHDLDKDQIVNALMGIKQLYELKFNKLWDLFEEVHMKLVRDEKMAREDANALRQQLFAETQGYGGAGGQPTNSGAGTGTRFGQLDTQGFGTPVIKGKKK
jgi:hypothetical protein